MKTFFASSTVLLISSLAIPAVTQSVPKAVDGYSVGIFARSVPGKYTQPDSIAVLGKHIFIGYGDGNDPAGLDGKSNQIVEYNMNGSVAFIYEVVGHNDGLKVNPYTHKLWAMQNEDGNPNLVVIDPANGEERIYTPAAPPPHGGGYDDIIFRDGKAYFSASNPAHNPNTEPALVEVKLQGDTFEVSSALEGNAKAKDVVTGAIVTLNLQDPDSTTVTPAHDILLDSQGDSELVLIHNAGLPKQSVLVIPLSSPFGIPQADDTIFTTSDDGFILAADTPANIVYKIHKNGFVPGTGYTAAVGAPDQSGASVGFVGELDLSFGDLSPVVTGFQSPHGMAFVNTDTDDNTGGGTCSDAPQSTVNLN